MNTGHDKNHNEIKGYSGTVSKKKVIMEFSIKLAG